jgi:Na+-translocating ferredoxin:NAD+ oxidoreductase RnfC subunit
MPPKNGIIKGSIDDKNFMSHDSSQPESAKEHPIMEVVHTHGINGASKYLIDYFSVPGREAEIELFLTDLKFHGQAQFIEILMEEVFESESYHHQPLMIAYRKKIAEIIGVTKGQINLKNAFSQACDGKPDAAIAFLRANPTQIESFLGKLNKEYPEKEYPGKSKAAILNLVEHLLKKLQIFPN